MTIARPRYVVLDSSHIGDVVRDTQSRNREQRHAAQRFLPDLIAAGCLPLFCWHQLEELLQHNRDEVVESRLQYLRSIPLLAWVRPPVPEMAFGSILDIFTAEVLAAFHHPHANPVEVRDLARATLFAVGAGSDAVPESFRDWRLLRGHLAGGQRRAAELVSISRWRAEPGLDSTPIGAWLKLPRRSDEEAKRMFAVLASRLAGEIAARGDKRITDPIAVADAFLADAAEPANSLNVQRSSTPALQLLVESGLDPDEINPAETFAATMDRLTFHKRLRIVAENQRLSWPELKRVVTASRLPVTVIEHGMREHAQDQAERKGSDLNDRHLLCLAPYAHATFVDKRTWENARRLRRKVALADRLIGNVEKAANFGGILAQLARNQPQGAN